MAIIIGDLHGNLNKAQAFLSYQPQQTHVALGDYVDSFTETPERQKQCLELLLKSDVILLWGNHDLHYLSRCPWRCTGYQSRHADLFRRMYDTAKQNNRLLAAYAVDGYICTHAGIAPQIAEIIPQKVRSSSEKVAEWLNDEFDRRIQEPRPRTVLVNPLRYGVGPLFNISYLRGGREPYGGIFWFDPFRERLEPSYSIGKQLFGHTERGKPEGVPGQWWDLDTTNSTDCWIFDTVENKPVRISP